MPRCHSAVASFLVLVVLASGASGQLTPTTGPATFQNDNAADFVGPLMAMGNTDGNLLSLVGDYNQPVEPGATNTVTVGAYRRFTVGPLPIEVFNLTLRANAKWVNGGGPETLGPQTSWTITGGISEAFSGIGVISTPSITGNVNGNGYRVIDETRTRPGSYVLAAGMQYTLSLTAETVINTLDVQGSVPQMVITNEFGKISNYRGYDVSFSWRTVPAPGFAGLGALGLTMSARRRRRG